MVKNQPANAGDSGSIPGLGRSLGGGNGTHTHTHIHTPLRTVCFAVVVVVVPRGGN